jgi:hypothetical protein
VALIFFRRFTISTTISNLRVIVIPDSADVEIISQLVIEEQTPQALESRLVDEEVEL